MRKLLTPLAATPLHPQWLVLRDQRAAMAAVTRHARGTVLDIGCGDRRLEAALPPACRYIGLDYPGTVLLGYPGHPHVFADAQNLPFADQSIETVILLDVLEHIAAPEIALSEIYRVLKPGGVLILQVPFLYPLHDEPYDFRRWTLHGLQALLDSRGFRINETSANGQPVETACALLALALAKSTADALVRRHPAALLMPLAVAGLFLINLAGWSAGKLLPSSTMMPLSYRVIGYKRS